MSLCDVLEHSNIITGELSNNGLTVNELNDTLSSIRQEQHRLGAYFFIHLWSMDYILFTQNKYRNLQV